MNIYNEEKTKILERPDLSLGYLKPDRIEKFVSEQKEIPEKFHYETIKEYSNGGKDVKKVIDVQGQPYIPAHNEFEDILIYILYTPEEIKQRQIDKLRVQRESECFLIINRGLLWYDTLTNEQRVELSQWYHEWLDVTETFSVPEKPNWLK